MRRSVLEGFQVEFLERMYRKHGTAVRQICASRLRVDPDVDDAVQEVFHRAAQHGRVIPEEEFWPWLSRIAINVCNDEFRRRKRLVVSEPDTSAHDTKLEANPEATVLSRIAVQQLLDRLTPAERRVVTRKWLFGQSHVSSSSELKIHDSTARALLTRARKRLLDYLLAERAAVGGWMALQATSLRLRLLRPRPAEGGGALATAGLMVPVFVALSLGAQAPVPADPAAAGQGGPAAAAGMRLARQVAVALPGAPGGGTRGTTPARATGLAPGARPDSRPIRALGHAPSAWDTQVADIQASPDYDRDHQLVMVGSDAGCQLPPCGVVFRSSDGGTTWAMLGHYQGVPSQVLLPSTYSSGRFYVLGSTGLSETSDGGHTFTPVLAAPHGYAGLAPSGFGADVVVSDANLTPIAGLTPRSPDLFPAGMTADGMPVVDAARGAVLQPAAATAGPGAGPDALLSCALTCTQVGSLPWAGPTSLDVGADGTSVLALAGGRLALSHDGGQTFAVAEAPGDAAPLDAVLLAGPSGAVRSVAVFASPDSGQATSARFSDDGRHWESSGLPVSGLQIGLIRRLGTSRILMVVTQAGSTPGTGFLCSTDRGASWSGC